MKTYIIYLLIPVALVLFAQTTPEKEVAVKQAQTYNIDSLVREREAIKQQISQDTKVFKTQVDSIKEITKTYLQELKNIEKDTTFVSDTIEVTTKKKKGWFKRTIDKIKNKQ